jgi:hypothetical protein
MIQAKERLDKIEAAIAGLLISPPPVTIAETKSVKKVVVKKKAKAKKKVVGETSVKTTSDQIAQVEM